MKRRPEELVATRFDAVVVGGGVVGALTAWDAALRGLSVALVERGDFGGCTSAQSLRIVHGGLRYLSAMDLPRVRASMAERAAWLRMAPHLVEPLPVLVPWAGGAAGRLPGLSAALRAMTAALRPLTGDPNRDVPGDRRVPTPRVLTRRECTALVPELENEEVSGGVLFHDALMYSPERLVLEAVQAAGEAGAVVMGRSACEGPLVQGGVRVGIQVRDLDTGESLEVRSRTIVVAAGAWGPRLAGGLLGEPLPLDSEPSLGVNLTLKLPAGRVAVAWGGGADEELGRLLSVPWRGRTVLGTAHLPWPGTVDADAPLPQVAPDAPVVESLLAAFNRRWPGPAVDASQVTAVQAGFIPARPPKAGARTDGRVNLTRRPVIRVRGEGAGAPVIVGETVNFTSARAVAEQLVDRVCRDVRFDTPSCLTTRTRLPGAPRAQVTTLLAAARTRVGAELPDDVITHLVRTYGIRYPRILAHRDRDPDWSRRVVEGRPVIRAQLLEAVLHEGARTEDDILARRTELAATGEAPQGAREEAAEVLECWRDAPPPEAPEPVEFATWLVDGHAHFHPLFEAERGWTGYVDTAARNFSRAATTLSEPVAAGCLLLAGGPRDHALKRLRDQGMRELAAAGWSLELADGDGAVVLRRGDGLPMVVVEGRQVVTTEGVEVLALCTAGAVGEGRTLDETIHRILEVRGAPVLPWGFGKWWGRRGRLVSRWLQEHVYSELPGGARRLPVSLGDNGNRLRGAPVHPLFGRAMDRGVPVLAGSDPLPLAHHVDRVGTFGFRLTGPLDQVRPLASLRWTLEALGGTPPGYGVPVDPVEFVRAQVAMQRKKGGGGAPLPAGAGEGDS